MKYRPPGNSVKTFVDKMDSLLIKIEQDKTYCFLLCDYKKILNVENQIGCIHICMYHSYQGLKSKFSHDDITNVIGHTQPKRQCDTLFSVTFKPFPIFCMYIKLI